MGALELVLAVGVVVAVTAALLVSLFWLGHFVTRGTSDDLLGLICVMWVWDAIFRATGYVLYGAAQIIESLVQPSDD